MRQLEFAFGVEQAFFGEHDFESLERLEHFALSGEVQLPHDERSFAARAVIIDFAKRQNFVAVGGPKPQPRDRRPPHFGADLVMVVFERKVAMPRRMMLEIGDFARDGDVAENRIGLQHAFDVRVEVADRKGRFGSENWGEKVLHEKGSLATRRAVKFLRERRRGCCS